MAKVSTNRLHNAARTINRTAQNALQADAPVLPDNKQVCATEWHEFACVATLPMHPLRRPLLQRWGKLELAD